MFSTDYDPLDEYVLCRLVLLNERLLIVEPDVFIESEQRIETRYGVFQATIRVEKCPPATRGLEQQVRGGSS
jgi:hypothetical protein